MSGFIVRLTDKQFFKEFGNADLDDFYIVILSHVIPLREKYPNAIKLKKLCPPSYVMDDYIDHGTSEEYESSYKKYLYKHENITLLTVLVSAVIEKKTKMLLVTSEEEDEYYFTKIICEVIEELFLLKSYSFKKYLKTSKPGIDNLQEVKARLFEIRKKLMRYEKERKDEEEKHREKMYNKLMDYDKEELEDFCIRRGIRIDFKNKRKKIIKTIIKVLFHESEDDDNERDY